MDADLTPRTRRALLSGGVAGAVAVALTALGRPAQVQAANGDNVKLGQGNAASSLTAVNSSSNGFKGKATGAGGIGIIGESTSATGVGVSGFDNTAGGIGVRGKGTGNGGIGVHGLGPRGVLAEATGPGGIGIVARNTATTGTGNGVRALAFSAAATALYAENSADGGGGKALHAISSTDTAALIENVQGNTNGTGLVVTATGTGVESEGRIGVLGSANLATANFSAGVRGTANHQAHVGGSFENLNGDGTSLEVTGGLKFIGASGKATITNGGNSVTVNPDAPVRNSSIVLATLQGSDVGASVERVDVGANSFTIHLTNNASAQCVVGWMILN